MFNIIVEPIPPEKTVSAFNNFGGRFVDNIQGMGTTFIVVALIICGLFILVGAMLSFLGLTKKILASGIGMLIGIVVLYVCVFHGSKVIGIISGFVNTFFQKF